MSKVHNAAVGILACTAVSANPALAMDGIRWINAAGGLFGDASNWDSGRVPTGSDSALFELSAAYTVGFTQSYSVDDFYVRFGEVTADLAGQTLTVLDRGGTNPGLQVGAEAFDDGVLHIRHGTLHVWGAGIADNGNSFPNPPKGLLTLSGEDAALVLNSDFRIGETGEGTLRVSAGAKVRGEGSPSVIGSQLPSRGLAQVTGAGSELLLRDMYIGHRGHGTLLVEQGGLAQSTRVIELGGSSQGVGLAIVRGEASVWRHRMEPANSSFTVGAPGAGALAVLDGGMIDSDETIVLSGSGTLLGDGVVRGAVRSSGEILPGGDVTDNLELDPSGVGRLTIDGTLELLSDSLLTMELGGLGSGTEHDELACSGRVDLDGTLRVSLLDGFEPVLGDSFTLMTASEIFGGFGAYDLPDLGAERWWEADVTQGSVVLMVVPGPGGLVALGLGVLAAGWRRR
jgi:T5SS/PEP-CTERM-associated repeat protein